MATASQMMRIVADRTDLPFGNVRNVARRLIESGIWPAGYGSTVPELSTKHIALLLLALLSGCKAKNAPALAARYYNLVDDSGSKIGDELSGMIDCFRSLDSKDEQRVTYQRLVYHSEFEVGCTQPYVRWRVDCVDGDPVQTIYIPEEDKEKKWGQPFVHRSMTLPGKVIFDIAADVFSKGNRVEYKTVPAVFKLGTVNGQPIKEWKADAERELARLNAHLDAA